MSNPEIEAARLLLTRLGVTPEQLVAEPTALTTVPTFVEYIDRLTDAVPEGTRRVYATYWRRIAEAWGDRLITEPTPTEISNLCETMKNSIVVRKNARGGRSAVEHLISALRCLYINAIRDGILSEHDNPAQRIPKPRRLPSTRRAIPHKGMAQIANVAATTGDDPELDTLILRLHTETACRRGGALALTSADLDQEQCLIKLKEKGGTVRWQPASPTLMIRLHHHANTRGLRDRDQLLRYRTGHPITTRRYDYIWKRIGQSLPWVAIQGISTHWLRHTTLTWVERTFGYAIAREYAGHAASSGNAGITSIYTRATLAELALALATLTGERHPLAAKADREHRWVRS